MVPINHRRYTNLTCTQCLEERGIPGRLRPRIVLYRNCDKPQDRNPDYEAKSLVMNYDEQHPPDAHALFVVGASCALGHIRGLIQDIRNAIKAKPGPNIGPSAVWINLEDPPESMMEDNNVFDVVVKADCQDFALWCLKGLTKRAQRIANDGRRKVMNIGETMR